MRIATLTLGLLAVLTPLSAAWSKEGQSNLGFLPYLSYTQKANPFIPVLQTARSSASATSSRRTSPQT